MDGEHESAGASFDAVHLPGDSVGDWSIRERLLMAFVTVVDFLAAWAACYVSWLAGLHQDLSFGLGLVVFFTSLPIHLWGIDTVRAARHKREAKAFADKWRPGGFMYEMQAPLDPH